MTPPTLVWRTIQTFSLWLWLLLIVWVVLSPCVAINETTTKGAISTPPATLPPTTLSPEQSCAQHNGQCSSCVEDSSCFYCMANDNCSHIEIGSWKNPLNVNKCGSLNDMRWKTCAVNLQILIISLSVAAAVVILGIIICCCCWRYKLRRRKLMREERKWEQQMEERKSHREERKKERQSKLDEIRRKYGLRKDNQYSRFED